MNRLGRRGFTLIELLVVIAIIGILIILLLPAFSGAYQFALQTTCQRHLKTIWDAMGSYRADKGGTLYVTGRAWNGSGMLLPYLEKNTDVYHCPCVTARLSNMGGSVTVANSGDGGGGSSGGGSSGGGSGGGGSGGGSGGAGDTSTGVMIDAAVEISFDIYDGPSFSHFLWNCSIDSEWCKKDGAGVDNSLSPISLGPSQHRYEIEDQGWHGGGDMDFRDIDVVVNYDARNNPTSILINQMGGKKPHGYRFNLLINGELVVHDIDSHQGETIQLQSSDPTPPSGESTTTGSSGAPKPVQTSAPITYTYVPSDYGMSVGYYSGMYKRAAPYVDSKLFMVLDYPMPLADYTDYALNISSKITDFDVFFIDTDADPGAKAWLQKYSSQYGTNWQMYQALRHFNRANMLYCDGHIESLGYQDLGGPSPLLEPRWQFGRQPPSAQ